MIWQRLGRGPKNTNVYMLQDKNVILARMIMGEATEQECQYLKENCSQEELAEILNANDLAERYRIYASIDEKEAYEKASVVLLKGSRARFRFLHRQTLWRVAAVVLLLIVGGAWWWYRDYTKVTPPEISQDVLAAIQTSKERGKSEARIETLSANSPAVIDNDGGFTEEMIQQLLEKVSSSESTAPVEGAGGVQPTGKESLELISTLHDKEFWLTLDDGTLVHMNSSSRIIYPEKFSRDRRDVILTGEAYFMVAKDKSRPFMVHTPQGDVKVYGTEFHVNTRSRSENGQRNATSVVLVEGSVGVTPTGGTEYMLTPGQQFSILDGQCLIQEADLRPYIAWNTRKFDFDDYPLQDLMEIIYRWYNIDYVIADPAVNSTLVSGSISRYDTIEPLLHAISKITGHPITIKNNTIYINK